MKNQHCERTVYILMAFLNDNIVHGEIGAVHDVILTIKSLTGFIFFSFLVMSDWKKNKNIIVLKKLLSFGFLVLMELLYCNVEATYVNGDFKFLVE